MAEQEGIMKSYKSHNLIARSLLKQEPGEVDDSRYEALKKLAPRIFDLYVQAADLKLDISYEIAQLYSSVNDFMDKFNFHKRSSSSSFVSISSNFCESSNIESKSVTPDGGIHPTHSLYSQPGVVSSLSSLSLEELPEPKQSPASPANNVEELIQLVHWQNGYSSKINESDQCARPLRVSNLSLTVSPRELMELFSSCGGETEIHLSPDRSPNSKSRTNLAIVNTKTRSQAQAIMDKYHLYPLNGHMISIDYQESRSSSQASLSSLSCFLCSSGDHTASRCPLGLERKERKPEEDKLDASIQNDCASPSPQDNEEDWQRSIQQKKIKYGGMPPRNDKSQNYSDKNRFNNNRTNGYGGQTRGKLNKEDGNASKTFYNRCKNNFNDKNGNDSPRGYDSHHGNGFNRRKASSYQNKPAQAFNYYQGSKTNRENGHGKDNKLMSKNIKDLIILEEDEPKRDVIEAGLNGDSQILFV